MAPGTATVRCVLGSLGAQADREIPEWDKGSVRFCGSPHFLSDDVDEWRAIRNNFVEIESIDTDEIRRSTTTERLEALDGKTGVANDPKSGS